MALKKVKHNVICHCFPDLLANTLFLRYCCAPRVTPGVLIANMVDQAIYIPLPRVMENYFNVQNWQMFNGAVQGCSSVVAHCAYVT